MRIRVNPWLDFVGALGAGVVVVVFCCVLLWHDPLLFWNDDYEVSILPVFADVALKVDSYRGLMPTIEIPAGMSGRLRLVYRPWWLIYGGAISLGCLVLILLAAVRALATRPPQAG